MNFFQVQNKLFYSKSKTVEELDVEGEQAFVPFMINRWLSFYDKSTPLFINETLNKFHSIFDDKNKTFKLYFHLIPKLKFKRIEYIKKVKKEPEDDEHLKLLARSHNISTREVKQYIELHT